MARESCCLAEETEALSMAIVSASGTSAALERSDEVGEAVAEGASVAFVASISEQRSFEQRRNLSARVVPCEHGSAGTGRSREASTGFVKLLLHDL